MHGCYNCYFPIAGAPHAWPKIGQDLPLTLAGVGAFHCTYDYEEQWLPNGFQFRFISASGHIDGPGSMIQFSIYNDFNTRLGVHAVIQRQLSAPLRTAYVAAARVKWQEFATNLNGSVHS